MADFSTPLDMTTTATRSRPLLASLTSWWSPAASTADAEPVLGYESAHPWALGEDTSDQGHARHS
jgi:hypothetical protein